MEAQEPTLRLMAASFSWSTSPRFPDVRGLITDIFRKATGDPEEWSWDSTPGRPMVGAANIDRRLYLFMTGTRLEIVSEDPEDPVAIARDILGPCIEAIDLAEIFSVGATCSWVLAAPTADDAAAVIEHRFGATNLRDVLSPLGGRPSRFSVDATFSEAGGATDLTIAPVTVEELLEDHLMTEFDASELPPAAILARIGRTREVASGAEDALSEVERIVAAIRGAGEKLWVA